MPLHDQYLRRTPYERFLPDETFPERHFPAIRAESERRGIGLADPGAFAMLESASEALGELRTEGESTDTLARHALMLFHAFHHHAAGAPNYLLETPVLRLVADAEPWSVGADAGELEASVYLQLPQHLVWAREGDGPPSSIDGLFRTVTDDGRVHVMAVAGVVGERPGFTVIPVAGAPLSDEAEWVSAGMRGEARDFSTEIPGAELERLYEIRTAGEMLKLVARAARVVVRDRVATSEAAPAETPAGGPPASTLPGLRIGLGDG
ncbi:MAG: hypothetical protein KJP18_11810 [Gemmatimonadetes bacterium]|nr:hypothetical protein [Gemmatimonadota bacterium]NNK62937.1 hypothetical protein [Gemmatimonadota bacterium]